MGLSIVLAPAFCRAVMAQPNAAGEYQVYRLRHKPAAEVEKTLAEVLSDFGPAVHLVANLRENQILLLGPQAAQQIARRLIDSVDRAAVERAAVERPRVETAPATPMLEAYPVPNGQIDAIGARLRARFAERRDVRVVSDAGTSQLLILAPPEIHAVLAREFGAPAGRPPAGDPDFRHIAESVAREGFVPLSYSRVERIEPQLQRLLGSRLEPLPNRPSGRADYLFVDEAGRRVEMRLDRQRNQVALVGPRPLVEQLGYLVRALDALDRPEQEPGAKLRIIPVRRADPAKVREAVNAYRMGRGGGASYRPGTIAPGLPHPRQTGTRGPLDRASVQLVQYLAQAEQAGAAPASRPQPGDAPTAEALQAEEEQLDRLRELGEQVEIETLPDLDVIILRGPDRDLDEVSRIIAEIERLSAETQPVIEIYQLRHVRGEAMITIISQVAESLVGGRQGRASITPLVKPNALLLIGWGEAVAGIKELIAKLDQPVGPESDWRVFRLKHAAASVAADTVEEFLGGSDGLGPRVEVTTDERTNSLIVRGATRDLIDVERLIARIDRTGPDAVNQGRIVKLKHSLANDLAGTLREAIAAASGGGERKSAVLELLTADVEGGRLLKSGLLSDVEITPDVHTNTLIISGPAESMDLLSALIRELDVPTGVAQIKVFRIVNGDANAMILMLRTLLPAQAGTAPQLAGAEGETTLVPVRFSVDSRTNSIIATGSEGDLAIIEALLLRLDEEDVTQRKNEVYRLKNSPASQVAQSINEFLRSERVVQQAMPGVLSPFQQIETEVVVVPETVTNSLIISASPRFFDEIVKLVEELDAAPPQVMIQVIIAEVQLTNIDEFGIELGLQDSVLFDRSLLGSLLTTTRTVSTSTPSGIVTVQDQIIQSATNTPGYDFNNNPLGNSGSDKALARSGTVGSQGLSHFNLGRMSSELGYGGLVLSASSESVSMLIRALQESRKLEILGRPQIMTLDNQSAFIQVGKQVPRISGSRFDGRTQINQIELEPTGLMLAVTPRISPEGMVVMEVDAEKSELGPEAEGIPVSVTEGVAIRQPSINITLAQTTVSAASGETIVIGGLINKYDSKIERRVPYLSDIPILGHLFRYDNDTSRRNELLIILTPHVVKDAADAERIKQIEAARMSWCLADVHAIHGPTGLYEDRDTSSWQGQGEVVYPDENPRGLMPGAYVPEDIDPKELNLSPSVPQAPTQAAPGGDVPATAPQGPPPNGSASAWPAPSASDPRQPPGHSPPAGFDVPRLNDSRAGWTPDEYTTGQGPSDSSTSVRFLESRR